MYRIIHDSVHYTVEKLKTNIAMYVYFWEMKIKE